ncbi:DNA helicase B isoform X2 [Parus major]|uniref:DNA helicase B isoform X2 n=1 Tax=Parus major TaxID=9157 RepID=UPI000771242F|nr:DNA helicase B isoform X2 [Parus major]
MAECGGQRGATLELWGHLRPLRSEAPGDEEESDEDFEEEPLLAEDALLEAGGRELAAALPPRSAVIIQECGTKKQYEVVGRFPLVDPWWKVNVKIKKMGSKYFVQGYPSYFLQTDVEENNRQVFSLFLKECGVPENWKEKFFAWLPMEFVLSFSNLEEKLKQFQVSQLQPRRSQIDTKDYDIFYYVSKSFAGKAVLGALVFPGILEFLPILLPRHFCCLLDKMCWQRKADTDGEEVTDEMVTKLDEILKDEPWKLGFSRIMYKELNLPYCEATWAAFCQCEHLLRNIPDLQKNALILYDQLKTRCRQMGHTYEDQDELARFVSKHMSIEHVWQSLEFLKDQNVVIKEKKLVFLPHLYKSEKDIAMYVGDLLSNHTWKLDVDVKKILSISEAPRETVDNKMDITQAHEMDENNPDNHNGENHFPEKEVGSMSGIQSRTEVDKDQVIAVKKICSNPVTIISGKGGCGKSTIVSSLFRHLKQMEKEVEAASKDFEEDLDASEEWNTFDHHWESENMYAKKILNVLFTAPTGRATSLLREKTQLPAYTLHQVREERQFSEGDTRQLPSIDPGNMLADIFEGLKSRGFSVELRTNHRAESQLIVDNASRISHRQLPEFDEVLRVSAWNEEMTMPIPEKKFIFIALPAGGNCENLQTAIKLLLKKGPGLEDAKQSQFIAFRRQDCDLINELCCQHYSNHLTRDHKNRLLFQNGDKIASTRNVYLKDLLAANGVREGPNSQKCRSAETTLTAEADEEGKRLCNGDIFFITEDAEIDKQRLLTISSTYGGSTFTVNYKALRKLCHIKHAWARTIHTFQGSEERTVVYVVGNAGRQHWQHVYTAVTRGRCRVYIVAEELHLRKAVRNKEINRKTRLQRFLREAVAETNSCPERTSSSLMKCWQSQELETQSVSLTQSAPDPPELQSDLVIQERSSVLSEEQTISLQQSPCKRQIPASEDATKIPSTTAEESPLGSSRLKNLSLGQQIPRKLFKS